LCRAYTRGIQEALTSGWPEEDLDSLVDALAAATTAAISAQHVRDSKTLILGLGQLSTSAHQVSEGAWNQLTRPATALATAERTAEEKGLQTVALHALACWAVAVAYPLAHVEVM
jgi:hypothetical protein